MVLPLSARTLRRRLIFAVSAPAVLAVAHLLIAQSPAPAPGGLQDGFVHSSPDARPMMRWWWFGSAMVKRS